MNSAAPESGIDWEDAFTNADHIPGGDGFPAIWEQRAHAFRDSWPHAETDIAYGDAARERFDLFRPDGLTRGLVVFVHGGYWMRMHKGLYSDLAAGPLAHGWAVAMPSYTLAPETRIAGITRQIGAAISKAATMVDGPIRLAGHSAGGHLVTRMICEGGPLPTSVSDRIDRVVSISGVHDLRPVRLHSMNETLQIDGHEAKSESPVLLDPLPGKSVTCWTGALERPEFLRQSQILAEAWAEKTNLSPAVYDPGRHHFDVIDGLKQADHPLTQSLLG
ncbi:alpha/beta hydrolase [Nioella sp. MMSF_3534]|uniref:alpha/beta hydrolase n=1 Tax=Nioella sp. MMSF_3534 TaxID=3046720 RepID=UPI00273F376C|nr:alpha/beta hydrolase [Nioella sp. MMSF_3534]